MAENKGKEDRNVDGNIAERLLQDNAVTDEKVPGLVAAARSSDTVFHSLTQKMESN